MRPNIRVARCALTIGLVLSAPFATFADSLVCQAIRRGESALQAARRITGDSRNIYQPSFQIMNPSSRFVPKSQYDRVRAGWRACVVKPLIGPRAPSHAAPVESTDVVETAQPEAPASVRDVEASAAPASISYADLVTSASGRLPFASEAWRAIAAVDFTMLWVGAAMAVPWCGWRMLDGYLARRKTTAIVMQHFADRFISEFERPLVRYSDADRAVRSHIRWGARHRRFDILLAPQKGRRYPNLSDHKKNVEYDVARVQAALGDTSFVCGPLYTQAGWVVVPFQFQASRKQPGGTCISSF